MATGVSLETKSSEERFDYTCSVCTRKGRVSEAVKYCQVCQKYLCTSCLEHHNEYMEDHTLVDPTDSKTVVMPTDNCERHVTEKVKMWCKGHNEALCTICAFMNHRTCADIVDITADISSVFKDDDLHKVEAALKTAKSRITLLVENENTRKENTLIKKNEYICMVEQHKKKLINMIEALGQASIKEINNWYTDVQNELEDSLGALSNIEKHIVTCLNEIEANTENKAQLFVTVKKGEKIAGRAEELTTTNVTQDKAFQMESGIENYLSNIQSLLESVQCSTLRLFKIKEKRNINVKSSNDAKNCDIESTCVLSDGSILMTDRENKKLKRLDSSTYTVTDYCDMPEDPRAVCCVGQEEVAVSLDGKKIQFVSVGKTMTCTRSVVVKHLCQGIAYRDGEMFVNGGDGKVYVYNLSGKSLRIISVTLSVGLSAYAKHITIDGDRLYITGGGDEVLCTDIQGKELYRYTDTKLSGCVGVSVDGRGGVFLSGFKTHNVVQLGAGGKELGEILTKADGLVRPQSVCYDPNKHRLIVTCYEKNSIIVCDLM